MIRLISHLSFVLKVTQLYGQRFVHITGCRMKCCGATVERLCIFSFVVVIGMMIGCINDILETVIMSIKPQTNRKLLVPSFQFFNAFLTLFYDVFYLNLLTSTGLTT